jgi:hypothetical protein
MMGPLKKTIFCAAMGTALLAIFAASASAAIVCAGRDCWHTTESYEYPKGAHVIVHPDDWSWGPKEPFRWREHEGRGYWRGSRWMEWK